jgi:tRNA threonylcarbamoyladenosine biosynthesis protein TsaB
MLILVMDTSGDVCTLGVVAGARLVAQNVFRHKMDLLRRLAPNIKTLMDDTGVAVGQLDAIAVSLGPGSFTGLRIGVATAKALAYAADKKIVGIPTLDALAHGVDAEPEDVIAPLITARPGEVYNALYRRTASNLAKLTPDSSLPIEEFLEQAAGLNALRIVFCGSGAAANKEIIEKRLGATAVFAPASADHPRPDILGKLAIDCLTSGDSDDVLSIVPLYVRRPTPEIRHDCSRGLHRDVHSHP